MSTVPHLSPHGISTPVPGHTFADLLDAYEQDYLPLKAANSQLTEHGLLRWFRRDLGALPLADLTPLVFRTWRDSLRPHYKPNSIRRYLVVLSAICTVGVDHLEWLPKHPLRQVAKPPAPPDRDRALTAVEQARLLAECQRSRNPHLYVAVVVTLSTGTRKNELLQRLWTDIDLERGLLSIPQSKNRERRAIPLMPHALDILRVHALERRSPFVFPRLDGRKPWYADYTFRQACKRAGIANFHFHDLRHTAASYLAMSGASLREIAEILGHRSLKQTMRYTHLVEPHTRGVLEHMAERFLSVPSAMSAAATNSAESSAPPVLTLPKAVALQVLDAIRVLEPYPASAVQVAGMVGLPLVRVRALLQYWEQQGTVVRLGNGFYQARGSGADTNVVPLPDGEQSPLTAPPGDGAHEAPDQPQEGGGYA